jgi:hypothetical protein
MLNCDIGLGLSRGVLMSGILKSCLLVMFLTASGAVYSNPIIVKLGKICDSYSPLAIKFQGDTFVFGKFFQTGPDKYDVVGVTFSFKDFVQYEKEKIDLVTREGKMVLDVNSSSREKDEFKTYDIGVIIDRIKITQKIDAYYTVDVELPGQKPRNFAISYGDSNISADGIPYIYEPVDRDYFVYPSVGWMPGKTQYTRLYQNMYKWDSKTADQNYELIIKGENMEKHFDLLFGQGLFEYIVGRNAQEDITDEDVIEYRQTQSLILLAILSYYKQNIVDNYSTAFSISDAFDKINETVTMPKYVELWLKRSPKIEEKLAEVKGRMLKK